MIVDWEEVDTIESVDAILLSNGGMLYMNYTDHLLDLLIETFGDDEKHYKYMLDNVRDEKERRRKLEE